jgi:thioredoxin-dependent peroxiredoxin
MNAKLIIAAGAIVAASSFTVSASAQAAMTAGGPAMAPTTVLQSVIGGKEETYDLQKAAAVRPVVLYFFPKAFTGGCTIEARTFAARLDDFNKLGYDVVGASTDDIPTLAKFAAAENAGQRFVSDPGGTIAKAFGVLKQAGDFTYAGRVTFVIGTDGSILFKVDDPVPDTNIDSTYTWVKAHPAVKAGS